MPDKPLYPLDNSEAQKMSTAVAPQTGNWNYNNYYPFDETLSLPQGDLKQVNKSQGPDTESSSHPKRSRRQFNLENMHISDNVEQEATRGSHYKLETISTEGAVSSNARIVETDIRRFILLLRHIDLTVRLYFPGSAVRILCRPPRYRPLCQGTGTKSILGCFLSFAINPDGGRLTIGHLENSHRLKRVCLGQWRTLIGVTAVRIGSVAQKITKKAGLKSLEELHFHSSYYSVRAGM